MNKKRKILTVIGLMAFLVVMALHYVAPAPSYRVWWWDWKLTMPLNYNGHWTWTQSLPLLPDVQGFVFTLGVFYAGLYALLNTNPVKVERPKTKEIFGQDVGFLVGVSMVIIGIIGLAIWAK